MSKALLYSRGSAQRMPQRVWRYPPPLDNDTTTTTFFKPATKRRRRHRRSIEVWTTPCIVTCFGQQSLAQCSMLLNPANPQLSGVSQFPYFPRGGPVPCSDIKTMHKDWQPLGHVSSWGGMEVGSGMMYAVSVVDGLVHQLGGWKLRAACHWYQLQAQLRQSTGFLGDDKEPDQDHDTATQATTPQNSQRPMVEACPIGHVVETTLACDALLHHYAAIWHTTPPFYGHHDQPERRLAQCYQSALQRLNHHSTNNKNKDVRLAVPLVGAGARGFPVDVAIHVAAQVCADWMLEHTATNDCDDDDNTNKKLTPIPTTDQDDANPGTTVVFGLLEPAHAEQLVAALAERLEEPQPKQEE